MKKQTKAKKQELAPKHTNAEEEARLHREIYADLRTPLVKAIRIGELLTADKASMKHGEFVAYIEKNLPFTRKSE